MAILIRWQFDGCNRIPPEGYDKWWTDMDIEGQLQCEHALSYTGKGQPCVVIDGDTEYHVDLARMTQRNCKTGRVRPIRRTTMEDFDIRIHYFHDGRLRRRSTPMPWISPVQQSHNRSSEGLHKDRDEARGCQPEAKRTKPYYSG